MGADQSRRLPADDATGGDGCNGNVSGFAPATRVPASIAAPRISVDEYLQIEQFDGSAKGGPGEGSEVNRSGLDYWVQQEIEDVVRGFGVEEKDDGSTFDDQITFAREQYRGHHCPHPERMVLLRDIFSVPARARYSPDTAGGHQEDRCDPFTSDLSHFSGKTPSSESERRTPPQALLPHAHSPSASSSKRRLPQLIPKAGRRGFLIWVDGSTFDVVVKDGEVVGLAAVMKTEDGATQYTAEGDVIYVGPDGKGITGHRRLFSGCGLTMLMDDGGYEDMAIAIGECDNNEAETHGLRYGIAAARDLLPPGAQFITVCSDSDTAVKRVTSARTGGVVSSNIARECAKLANEIERDHDVEVRLEIVAGHTGINGNQRADTLAKHAAMSLLTGHSPGARIANPSSQQYQTMKAQYAKLKPKKETARKDSTATSGGYQGLAKKKRETHLKTQKRIKASQGVTLDSHQFAATSGLHRSGPKGAHPLAPATGHTNNATPSKGPTRRRGRHQHTITASAPVDLHTLAARVIDHHHLPASTSTGPEDLDDPKTPSFLFGSALRPTSDISPPKGPELDYRSAAPIRTPPHFRDFRNDIPVPNFGVILAQTKDQFPKKDHPDKATPTRSKETVIRECEDSVKDYKEKVAKKIREQSDVMSERAIDITVALFSAMVAKEGRQIDRVTALSLMSDMVASRQALGGEDEAAAGVGEVIKKLMLRDASAGKAPATLFGGLALTNDEERGEHYADTASAGKKRPLEDGEEEEELQDVPFLRHSLRDSGRSMPKKSKLEPPRSPDQVNA